MQAILVFTIVVQALAVLWSLREVFRLRDWRLGVFALLLVGMTLHRLALLQTPRGPNFFAEVFSDSTALVATLLSLLAFHYVSLLIAEKERAIQSLRASERDLRRERDLSDSIINSMPGVFYFYDESGRFLRWNQNFETVTGYSSEEMAHRHLLDFFVGDDKRLVGSKIEQVFDTEASEVEADFVAKSGEKTPYYFTGVRIEHLGRPCVLGVGIDVSALRRLEKELDRIVNLTPDLLCVTRNDGYMDRTSPAWRRITGWSDDELLSRPWLEFVHPDDRAATAQGAIDVFGGQTVIGFENRFRCRDGSYRWLTWSGQQLLEGFVLAVARDVTDHKRAEHALHESEERLRLALDAAQMGTWDWDVVTNQVNWSPWHEILFGYAPGEFGGTYESFSSRVHPDDLPRVETEFSQCLATNNRYSCEYRVVWPDGGIHWVQGIGEFAVDSSGKPLRMRGVVKEIGDRKHAEQERERLLAQEQRAHAEAEIARKHLANTLERITDAFVALDREWCYTFVNEKAAAVLGRTREELVGQRIWAVFPEAVGHSFHLACERAVAAMVPVEHEDYFPPFDRWFTNRIFPSPDGLTIAFQDITPRKRAEAALRLAHTRTKVLSRQLLTSLESERRHLARELHDEIGQVLTAVHLSLEQAKAVSDPSALPRLDESSRVVDRAIGQVRTMSLELRPAMLDDFGLISAVRWYIAQHADGLAVELAIEDCGAALSSEVSTTCYRVVQEGLTNVRRHARAKRAWVDVIHASQEIQIRVRDDGVGFDAPSVWARALEGGSFGILGMQERVELLGGRFELRSTLGHGSEVQVTLPLSWEGDSSPDPEAVPTTPRDDAR